MLKNVRHAIIIAVLKNRYLFNLFHVILNVMRKMEENIRLKRANENIVNLQQELVPLVSKLWDKKEIRFTTVPAVGDPGGHYWEPQDHISGEYIYKAFDTNPDRVIETSKKVADDYQKVIAEYFKQNPDKVGNLLEEGRNWLFGKLLMWGGSIVEEGLMSHREIAELAEAFEDIIQEKGEGFFGYFHGNTIGDHIYVDENETLYLLGMRIVPRPGKGYYDFLRALDWLLLKTDNKEANFNRTVGWIKQYFGQYDWEEVKLVMAIRCIGILGWDMLHRGDFGKGDVESKKQLLLGFIRRKY